MEDIMLIGVLIIIADFFVFLQILVMKLDKKIFHFVPLIFFSTLFIYGFLRWNGIIIYYTDTRGSFGNGWQWEGFFDCVIGVVGFLPTLITMIVIYIKRKKSTVPPIKKIAKIYAVCIVVLLTALSGLNIYKTVFYPFTENILYSEKRLVKIGGYMFMKLKLKDFNLDTHINKKDYSEYVDKNYNPSAYNSFQYTDFEEIYFLDEHTVCICQGAMFDSVKGYIVTDGEKEYSQKYNKIDGYDNLYSWSGETRPEYWNDTRGD